MGDVRMGDAQAGPRVSAGQNQVWWIEMPGREQVFRRGLFLKAGAPSCPLTEASLHPKFREERETISSEQAPLLVQLLWAWLLALH